MQVPGSEGGGGGGVAGSGAGVLASTEFSILALLSFINSYSFHSKNPRMKGLFESVDLKVLFLQCVISAVNPAGTPRPVSETW